MLNKVILIGRLTDVADLRYTQNGTPVATFDLAVNRPTVGQDGKREADFFRVVCWNKLAENVSQYTGKGSLVAVVGRLQTRKYQAKDGTNRTAYEVVADSVEFLDHRKPEDAANAGQDVPII
ncbi:MAG: single-stranded DNA-binding protein [Firmicutes bacterium]|nr:single-stranded DNA-binding protein [Bacillota bacterium]